MTRRVRLSAGSSLALLFGLLAVARLGAQTLRGTVRDPTNRPLPGVLVLMLDSTSGVAARALTNERGEFTTASPRAGTYRLRMMHIGFQPEVSEAVTLLSGGEITKSFVYTNARVALDTVRVVDRGSCQSIGDSAAITFRVWEQARTALHATQLTATSRTLMATTIAYDRVLEPDLRHVRQQRSNLSTAFVTQPWRAVSADSLHRAGFVVTDRTNTTTYHAPGIEVLLSPTFVADHCFRLVPPGRGHEQLMGIAFEPTSERKKLPEIRGTLWLDRKSAALQRLDFGYVHLSPEQEQLGGGELEFANMRNGAWAISRWSIRMPVLEQTMAMQSLGGVQTHVAEVHVTGGELALAIAAASHDTLWTGRVLTVAGTVVDSASGNSIANADVSLAGTSLSATTDNRGRFTIAKILPGTYTLEARTASLDSVGATKQMSITLTDSSTSIDVRVPSARQIASTLCSASHQTDASLAGIVVGSVRASDSTRAANARVTAEWQDQGSSSPRLVETHSDARGAYRLCGVPVGSTLTLRSSSETGASLARDVRITGDTRVLRADLVLQRGAAGMATLTGVVLIDSTKQPIAAAEITLVDLASTVLTDDHGVFQFSDVPPGSHHLTARRVGYGLLDASIDMAPNQTTQRTLHLSRAAALDSVVVNAATRDQGMREFEERRRTGLGRFLTRAELAPMDGLTLVEALTSVRGVSIARGPMGHGWALSKRSLPPACAVLTGMTPQCAAMLAGEGFYVPPPGEAEKAAGAACYMQIYINQTLVNPESPTEPFDLGSIATNSIQAIEVYATDSEVPMRYSGHGSKCGVIVLHTRR